MKKIISIEEHPKINHFLDWFLHMIGYALVLITVSLIFPKTIYIDNKFYGLYGLIAAIIIYFLNKTVKPILIWLTLPITSFTLGVFYPFVNVFILNIVDIILGNHFELGSLFMCFIVAICISVMNILMIEMVIKPIVERKIR